MEDLKFLIMRYSLRVTKIYSHYTFEQAHFKRESVLMNQKSRQNAKNAIEKDFFKLMNNVNFGYDCRNNANNVKFELIIDEVNEKTYIKKYYNLFDSKISNFVNSDVLEQEIEQNFQQQIANVKHDDPFFNKHFLSFIIHCFTYILLNFSPFFLEQKFDVESYRKYVRALRNYLIPNEFYIYIWINNNFIVLSLNSLNSVWRKTTTLCCLRNFSKRMHYCINISIQIFF